MKMNTHGKHARTIHHQSKFLENPPRTHKTSSSENHPRTKQPNKRTHKQTTKHPQQASNRAHNHTNNQTKKKAKQKTASWHAFLRMPQDGGTWPRRRPDAPQKHGLLSVWQNYLKLQIPIARRRGRSCVLKIQISTCWFLGRTPVAGHADALGSSRWPKNFKAQDPGAAVSLDRTTQKMQVQARVGRENPLRQAIVAHTADGNDAAEERIKAPQRKKSKCSKRPREESDDDRQSEGSKRPREERDDDSQSHRKDAPLHAATTPELPAGWLQRCN